MSVRRFNGTTDELRCAIGGSNLTGSFTIAVLARPQAADEGTFLSFWDATTERLAFGVNGSKQPRLKVGATTLSGGELGVTPATGQWGLWVVTKETGTTAPRWHHYGFDTGVWSHANDGSTVGNPASQSGGTIRFGQGTDLGAEQADFAAAVVFTKVLSDGEIEALKTAASILDGWKPSAAGLWRFRQSSVTEEVFDDTGNSASQTARTGTTAIGEEPPIPYEVVIFEFSPSGSSASSGSLNDELTWIESISGTSVSSFGQTDVFTFEEPVSGSSSSTGETTFSFEETIAMELSGESSSSWSMESSSEASESISGSSSSSGSESETLERSESLSGESSSSGSQEQIFAVEETIFGSSVSTFSETDEASSTEAVASTSVSSGSEKEEVEAQEAASGSSSSSGSQSTTFEIPQPDQPVPSPVKPRRRLLAVRWKFFLCDSNTMELLGEIKQARGRNLQLALDKPGGCGFNIPIDYDLFKDVEEINHGIIAYRGDTPRYSGMIWNLDENTDNNLINVQSVGWFETLNHRILRENVGYPPFSTGAVNAGQIVFLPAQGAVGTTSYHPGGLLTIANAQHDTWLVEGTNKDMMQRIISYQRGQNIGQAITQLSEIEAGFDFWVDPLSRVFDITNWDEVPDKTEDIVFGLNWGPKNIEKLGRQFDPSVMANRVTALGKYGGGFAEDIESQEKYQLFEEMPQLNDVVDPNVLLGYAGGEVLLRNRPRVLYSFQPFPYSGNKKIPQPFDDYDIGDKIAFTAVKPPRIDIRNQAVRIYGMNLDITDEGNEKVTALQISP